MKKFMFVLLITFISVILYATENIYVNSETLNVREAPDGKKIGVVNFGTKMEIVEQEGEWARVIIEGWVWKPLTLSENPNKENLNKNVVKPKIFRIVMWYSSLYSGAGSNNSKIGSIICRTDIFSSKRNNDLPAPRSDGGIIISESGLDKRLRIPFRYCKLILES